VEAPTDMTTIGAGAAGAPSIEPHPAAVGPSAAAAPQQPVAAPVDPQGATPDDDPNAASGSRLIRPYAMTGGRTTSNAEISLESQIQTSTRLNGDGTKYRWEAAKILKLAERPMALVEIAARAEIPIGVARVVISDLVEAGAVNVQRNAPVTSYTSLLEKVLDGIRDL